MAQSKKWQQHLTWQQTSIWCQKRSIHVEFICLAKRNSTLTCRDWEKSSIKKGFRVLSRPWGTRRDFAPRWQSSALSMKSISTWRRGLINCGYSHNPRPVYITCYFSKQASSVFTCSLADNKTEYNSMSKKCRDTPFALLHHTLSTAAVEPCEPPLAPSQVSALLPR